MRFQFYQAPDAYFYWRLLSGNHRIVAVAPVGFADPQDAETAAKRVQAHAANAVIDLTSDRGVDWRWTMRLAGSRVAECAHPYGRRVEAWSAAERFRRGAGEADVDGRILFLGGGKAAESGVVGPEHPSRRW